jgi:hypothetical protein
MKGSTDASTTIGSGWMTPASEASDGPEPAILATAPPDDDEPPPEEPLHAQASSGTQEKPLPQSALAWHGAR